MDEKAQRILADLAEDGLKNLRTLASYGADAMKLQRQLDECQGALASSQKLEELLRADLNKFRSECFESASTTSAVVIKLNAKDAEIVALKAEIARLKKRGRR